MASTAVLVRLVARRREALATHLPDALEARVAGVHQARVASRRLRELLPILEGVVPARKQQRVEKRMRTLTRALGPVRELDVTLATIDRLAEAHADAGPLLADLRIALERERATSVVGLTQRFDQGRAARLLDRLEGVEAALSSSGSPVAWESRLARRIRRRAHALHRSVADAGALFDSERLHAVRIAAKKLRYAMELAGESRVAPTGTLVRRLKEVQDALGALHDIEVLIDRARRAAHPRSVDVPGSAESEGSAAERAARWLELTLTAETRRLHARYLRRQTALVAVADRALDGVAPRLDAVALPPPVVPGV